MISLICAVTLAAVTYAAAQPGTGDEAPVAIVIHGGAGTILPENMTEETEKQYRDALTQALRTGHKILEDGGTSMDAVVQTLMVLEDSPLFNAGKGAVFTSEGTVELDASIMDGATRNAGALTGVTNVRNPIQLARAILDHSRHVMMSGTGAEAFAKEHGFEDTPNEYFYTERRREALRRAQSREDSPTGDAGDAMHFDDTPLNDDPRVEPNKFGTVGAVALDRNGDIVAGTSTGGMTNKRFGRVGDSPIIGAGTYAHNETCGVSATGHGEYFIRGAVAHDIAARMRYGSMSLKEAADSVVMDELPSIGEGGSGGVIALDAEGNIAMPFNTPGMYRGYVDTDGNLVVRIYGADE
jgi:beta-aspartyl-peptidase (threonine type)